jgi:sporulation protein YlmC with PRC-barrel domain
MKTPCLKLKGFVILAALSLAVQQLAADQEKSITGLSAKNFIGKEVRNEQNEYLGKIQDLIMTMDSGAVSVPYVVIAHGGTLGVGRTRTAVPMDALQCSGEGKMITLSASKEELRAASKTAGGRWASVKDAEWARSVDGFYEPSTTSGDRYARHRSGESTETRLLVRDPAPRGAELLMTPADSALCEAVCEAIDNVQVSVNNGVVTIRGQVENEEARQNLETRVKAISGVQKVESRLKLRNPNP